MTREELHSMIDDLFDKAEALKDKAEDAIDNADDKIEEAKILAEISAQDFENAIRRSVNKGQDAAVDRHSIPKTSKLPRIIKENHKTRY